MRVVVCLSTEEKNKKKRIEKKNQTEHFFLPDPITQEHFIKQQTPIHRWKIFTCRTWDAGKKSEKKKKKGIGAFVMGNLFRTVHRRHQTEITQEPKDSMEHFQADQSLGHISQTNLIQ